MGLATIINMIVFVCVPAWGNWAAQLAWALWWVDIALALASNVYLPFLIMYNHKVRRSSCRLWSISDISHPGQNVNHDCNLAPAYRRDNCRICFWCDRCERIAVGARPYHHHCQLHPPGLRFADGNGHVGALLPQIDHECIAAARSHRLGLPATRSAWSGLLLQHEIRCTSTAHFGRA